MALDYSCYHAGSRDRARNDFDSRMRAEDAAESASWLEPTPDA
jgi:hypothetical protein